MRGFKQPDVDFGGLPIRGKLWSPARDVVSQCISDAWSLHRSDLLQILLKGVPSANTHLGKKLKRYVQDDVAQVMRLEFSDGTSATCDVVVGCDGIRSNTRAQMMRDEAAITGRNDHLRCIDPRWSGTTAYRVLTPASRLAARNPNHSMLSGGQVVSMYLNRAAAHKLNLPSVVLWQELGQLPSPCAEFLWLTVSPAQHVVGYPISRATLNIAVNVTDPAKEGTRWPSSSWSRIVDRTQFARDVAPIFADWDPEVRDIMEVGRTPIPEEPVHDAGPNPQTAHSAIEWAIHDVEPLPFYAKGRVVLVGDSVSQVSARTYPQRYSPTDKHARRTLQCRISAPARPSRSRCVAWRCPLLR